MPFYWSYLQMAESEQCLFNQRSEVRCQRPEAEEVGMSEVLIGD
jgi:hypothetical protein